MHQGLSLGMYGKELHQWWSLWLVQVKLHHRTCTNCAFSCRSPVLAADQVNGECRLRRFPIKTHEGGYCALILELHPSCKVPARYRKLPQRSFLRAVVFHDRGGLLVLSSLLQMTPPTKKIRLSKLSGAPVKGFSSVQIY